MGDYMKDLKSMQEDGDTDDDNSGGSDDEEEEFESGSESSSEEEEEEDTGLTDNQNRLLYMVSLYTHQAESEEDREEWIRKQALMVLIYEGVVAQVLDYDYAPMSDLVENRRKYFMCRRRKSLQLQLQKGPCNTGLSHHGSQLPRMKK